jgi:hypothetical protein
MVQGQFAEQVINSQMRAHCAEVHVLSGDPHLCRTHSLKSSLACRAASNWDTRSKMQMPVAWLVIDGFAIHLALPSGISLTCSTQKTTDRQKKDSMNSYVNAYFVEFLVFIFGHSKQQAKPCKTQNTINCSGHMHLKQIEGTSRNEEAEQPGLSLA